MILGMWSFQQDTGATKFKILPLSYYAVEREGVETFGVLHIAKVEVLEEIART